MAELIQTKSMIGKVVSTGMVKTITVEVTTFKVHPLYHKRYRWTKKYLSDSGTLTPKIGDLVRIESHKPISKLKRWVVAEVVKANTQSNMVARKSVAKPTTKAKVKKKA